MKTKPKQWTPNEGATIVMDIINNATDRGWNNEDLTMWDCTVALVAAAVEARDPNHSGIQFSPHFILHGAAGKGKTLLDQLLFATDIAPVMTNDSQGVGQMALEFKHKVLKIDDASPAFFNNTALTAAVKFKHHNTWSAKTHGERQDNEATMAFITTNMSSPVARAAGLESVDAWNRRCLTMEWDKDAGSPACGPHRRTTSEL